MGTVGSDVYVLQEVLRLFPAREGMLMLNVCCIVTYMYRKVPSEHPPFLSAGMAKIDGGQIDVTALHYPPSPSHSTCALCDMLCGFHMLKNGYNTLGSY